MDKFRAYLSRFAQKKLRYVFPITIAASVLLLPAFIHTQTMQEYCSVPPSVSRTIPPNVFLVLEKDEGMLERAWKDKPYRVNDNYEGFFDPGRNYSYTSSPVTVAGERLEGGYFHEDSCQPSKNSKCFSGNLLNWALMSRLDLSRKALAGFGWGQQGTGKSAGEVFSYLGELISLGQWEDRESGASCVAGGGYAFKLTSSAGPNKVTAVDIHSAGDCETGELLLDGAQFAVRLPVPSDMRDESNIAERTGIIQKYVDRDRDLRSDIDAPRLGIRRWVGGGNVTQADIPSSSISVAERGKEFKLLLTAVSSLPAVDPSPPNLAVMMKSISDYVRGESSKYEDRDIDYTQTPYDWRADNAKACRRTYAVFVTTGRDLGGMADAVTSNCTSGQFSTPFSQNACNAYQSDHYSADGPLRKQNVITYVVHTTIPGGGRENADSLRYAASVTTGKYMDARGPRDIGTLLDDTLLEVTKYRASGTSMSVLSASSSRVASICQAYFSPSRLQTGMREVSWTGDLQDLWLDPAGNMREDTVQDRSMRLGEDKVVRLYFNNVAKETEAALFTSGMAGEGGTLASCSHPEIKSMESLKYLWQAGKRLTEQLPSDRRIFTSTKVRRGTLEIAAFRGSDCGFSGEVNCFTISAVSSSDVMKKAINADQNFPYSDIVRYVRGECMETGVTGDSPCRVTPNFKFRNRTIETDGVPKVWKLGDIIHSTPRTFGGSPLNTYQTDYADRSYYDFISDNGYRQKSSMTFVGANDGMLHAFRSGYLKDKGLLGEIKAVLKSFFNSADGEGGKLGEEAWAYIPFNAFPYLRYLADPNYCHMYFTDLPVRLVDASIGGASGSKKEKRSWRTVLIGGMRFGGACGAGGMPATPPGPLSNIGFSSYFAIDVTDPENPSPLWEFSDEDMGYATTFPSIVRSGSRDDNGNWYVMIGSGSQVLPKGGTDIGRNSHGQIYFLDMRTGALVKKIALDYPGIIGDILTVDIDRDYVSERAYFGTSYRKGKAWAGKTMVIDIPAALSGAGVAVSWNSSFGSTLFSGDHPFTASPEVAKDFEGNVWVYEGSGKYFSDLDEKDQSPQIFFGVKDKGRAVSEEQLYSATTVTMKGKVMSTRKSCAYDPVDNSFGLKEVVESIEPDSPNPPAAELGWKIELVNGERVISRPVAIGGIVDFVTYKPDEDICSYSGNSFLYAVEYTTGVAPASVAITSPEMTSGTNGVVTVNKMIPLGSGPPPTGAAIIITPSEEGAESLRKKIQVATGAIGEAENIPAFSLASKIVHWLKK